MYPRRLCSCDQVPASGPMYVHAGLEGSVIALTNVLGELVERYRYTAFGLLTVLDAEGDEKDSPALSPWLYHGRLYENESGLYWMRMRHYSPQLGRFLQPDPAGIAGGINLYAYSNNNPLRFFDPWGLWPAPDATIDEALKGFFGEMDAMMEQLWRNRVCEKRQWDPSGNSEGDDGNKGAANPELFIGIDLEIVGIFGFEFSGGFVLNLKNLLDSGVFQASGLASGANVGLAGMVGYAHRGVEGETINIDANIKIPTPTVSYDEYGLSGGSIGIGAGAGLSVSVTSGEKYTVRDLGRDIVGGLETVGSWF